MDITKKWVAHLRKNHNHEQQISMPPKQPASSLPSSPSSRSRAINASERLWWADKTSMKGQDEKGRSISASSPTDRGHQPEHTTQATGSRGHNDYTPQMMVQPETRPISQEQLVAEVKGIYAGLVMVETECIESSGPDANKLNSEQWQALIALHRTLLHEHHDFFPASQHPSASAPLRRLASKYAMPARMWRHGIHSFLELLRHRLPESLENMLTFIYLAYSMMALLNETVPSFEDTWSECLGDLGRYRMAIEDDDIRDREVWTGVSRHWYSKASDKSPITGRLYHHLAILARPDALQQLYCYTKSLCVPIPLLSAKESAMMLFDPVLTAGSNSKRLSTLGAAYMRAHGIFSRHSEEMPDESTKQYLDLLYSHMDRNTKQWIESRCFIPHSLACSLLDYGEEPGKPIPTLPKRPNLGDDDDRDIMIQGTIKSAKYVMNLSELFGRVQARTNSDFPALKRDGHGESLVELRQAIYPSFACPFYVTDPDKYRKCLVDSHLQSMEELIDHLRRSWMKPQHCPRCSRIVNEVTDYDKHISQIICRLADQRIIDGIPQLPGHPLPEDYVILGLTYNAESDSPSGWFVNHTIDEDEKCFELVPMDDERKGARRVLGHNSEDVGSKNPFDITPIHLEIQPAQHQHRQLKGIANSNHTPGIYSDIMVADLWFGISPTVMAY